jgi:hypothetical protein
MVTKLRIATRLYKTRKLVKLSNLAHTRRQDTRPDLDMRLPQCRCHKPPFHPHQWESILHRLVQMRPMRRTIPLHMARTIPPARSTETPVPHSHHSTANTRGHSLPSCPNQARLIQVTLPVAPSRLPNTTTHPAAAAAAPSLNAVIGIELGPQTLAMTVIVRILVCLTYVEGSTIWICRRRVWRQLWEVRWQVDLLAELWVRARRVG